MPFYARYAEDLGSESYFLEGMKKKSGDGLGQSETLVSKPLAIPLIIERIARGRAS